MRKSGQSEYKSIKPTISAKPTINEVIKSVTCVLGSVPLGIDALAPQQTDNDQLEAQHAQIGERRMGLPNVGLHDVTTTVEESGHEWTRL